MSYITEKDNEFVAGTYARFPVEIVSGKGSYLYGSDGKEYIDLGSGIGVTAFGIADPTWIKAVTEQLNKVQHASNLYYTEPCALLAEKLCAVTGMKKVFFGNSGAEANECAVKVARKYAQDKKGMEYGTIVTLKNSFHGRTLTTLAATGQDVFHTKFLPLTPGFISVPAGDLAQAKEAIVNNKVAGVLIECVQGEGGVIPQEKDYVCGLYQLCRENDVLFMVDEVQTGNGRTGKPYAYMNYGVKPDVVTTAKGLGGGLPIGACIIGEKAESVLGKGDHGSTFGGNPVACAGALTVLDRLTDDLMKEVNEKSAYLFEKLGSCEGIESVTGKGLMIGFKPKTKSAKEVVLACMEKGVLCLTAKDKVRLLPALNIPFDVLKKAADVILDVCRK